jgi:hypothetical protein
MSFLVSSESDLLEIAMDNYATFHRIPRTGVSPSEVSASFAGISGWFALTVTEPLSGSPFSGDPSDEEEGEEFAPSYFLRRSFTGSGLLSSSRKLRSILRDVPSDISVEREALKNFETFHGKPPGTANIQDVEATRAGVYGWAVPTFSTAKRNYELFKCLPAGSARLRDVLRSSAGALVWSLHQHSSTGDNRCIPGDFPSPCRRISSYDTEDTLVELVSETSDEDADSAQPFFRV